MFMFPSNLTCIRLLQKLLALWLLCLFSVYSEAASITRFDVVISVHDDASLTVHESFVYDFAGQKQHVLRRRISHHAHTDRAHWDQGLSLKSVSMDGQPMVWDLYRDELLIGVLNASHLDDSAIDWGEGRLTGIHQFDVRYELQDGLLPWHGMDRIIWHVTGNHWPVPIEKASITVHFPAALQQANVKSELFVSREQQQGHGHMHWIDEHTFTASYSDLAAHTGFSIALTYPAALLSRSAQDIVMQHKPSWLRAHWHWFSFALFAALMLAFWWRYGRDPVCAQVAPCYEPAKDANAALAAILLDDGVDDQAVYATLLELAAEQYLAIEKRASGLFFRRLKSEAGLALYKQTLMQALFKDADELDCKNMSRTRKQQLRQAYDEVVKQLHVHSVEQGLMRTNAAILMHRFRRFGYIVASLCIAAGIADGLLRFDGRIFAAFLIGLIFWFFLQKIIEAEHQFWKIAHAVLALGLMLWVFKTADLHDTDTIAEVLFTMPVFLQTLLLPMVFVCSRLMSAKTEKGAVLCAQLMGLKEFMQRVSSEALRLRLAEDPAYMHRLIPYAVGFGILPHWSGLMHRETQLQRRDRLEGIVFMDDEMDMNETLSDFEQMAWHEDDDSFSNGGSDHDEKI